MLVALIGAVSFPLGFLALIVVIVLLWILPPWRWFARAGASVGAFFVLTIGAGLGGQLDDAEKDASQQVAVGATPRASASATRAAKAPALTGERLDEAERRARAAGFTVSRHDASPEGRAIIARSGWLVCFQQVGEDGGRTLDLAAVKRGEPCPERDGEELAWPTMPDLLGKTWQTAVTTLTDLGVDEDKIEAAAHYLNDALPDDAYDDWRVCDQDPAEGEDITAEVTLELAHPDAGCTAEGSRLGDKDHDGRPDYRDSTDDRRTAGGGSSSGGSATDDGGSTGTGGSTTSGGSGSGGSATSGGGGSSSTGGSTGGGVGTVHPGAFCSPAGATGVTTAGTPMVCGPASDGRNRWHSS
ncbi:PASTA domain-containing protein [Streptomyces sp. NPDC047117]|uniref:PASTA domain-containing protein n=1 Tax=Streptomyces sp. NPDC047117 TaxID=3155379 RepID=UPI0033E604A1